MKLIVSYPTSEREYRTPCTYSYVYKQIEIEPVKILRSPCGIGRAANRYYYQAMFVAPDDAEFVHDGLITENIDRGLNKHFNPKNFVFVNNVAVLR